MPVYGAQGKVIFQEHLKSGKPLDNIQLNNINLENFIFSQKVLTALSCKRSILDNSRFMEIQFSNSLFEESNLKNAIFQTNKMNKLNFEACILLRSKFLNTSVYQGAFKRSYMQRVQIKNCSFKNVLFLNVEAKKCEIDNCVFMGCDFLFDDPGGITGLQGSKIKNCLFINCTFQGYALTDVELINSVFVETSFLLPDWEDINIRGIKSVLCSGIPNWKKLPVLENRPLDNEEAALDFINKVKGI